ncbi:S41 family peptidase [Sphingomonas sp.]|uniref:S41 family peptidase n=1 Tax=Sphingomonas sp. TaxID=28214 RepID=UPI001EC73625|nr:S41 family peptidase [Sphingomonas sp.]MBX3595673.1 hypothetical protein [Sphingomonas sp.]
MKSVACAVAAVALVVAGAASAQSDAGVQKAPARDYASLLRQDATAFRAAILDSHPGPLDTENPGFDALLDRSYRLAMSRAKAGIGYREYYWAMVEFGNAFDDGHLGVAPIDQGYAHPWAFTWPGFVVALRDGAWRVVQREGEARPAPGARLIGCDGKGVEQFAAERLGPLTGRWRLTATRVRTAPRLFLRSDNPWRAPAKRCTFESAGKRMGYRLNWTPIDSTRRSTLIAETVGTRFGTGIGLRKQADGGFWIRMGTFESDPQSEDGAQLTALVREIESRHAELASAPRLVFDLRGNSGGSSEWMARTARALWGKPWYDAKTWSASETDYRVSDGNIANFSDFAKKLDPADSPELHRLVKLMIAGMEGAKAKGQAFWRFADPENPSGVRPALPAGADPVRARIFVLTDFGCASACLDAVDVLTDLGATQVGQETDADTLYMEVRGFELPGGVMRAWLPTKVYRGRTRGSNVPAVPKYRWNGALADTDGIEAWIATLPAS